MILMHSLLPWMLCAAVVAAIVVGGPSVLSAHERATAEKAAAHEAEAAEVARDESEVRAAPGRWLMAFFSSFRSGVYEHLVSSAAAAGARVVELVDHQSDLESRTDAGSRRLVTRILQLVALMLLLPFLGLVAFLDFGIVSAVYPGGPLPLRVALSCVLLVAIVLFSVIALGGERHGLQPAQLSKLGGRRVRTLAALCFLGVALLMVILSAQRSLVERLPGVNRAQEAAAAAESEVPRDPALVGVRQGEVVAAKAGLARGERVDRTMAGGVALSEPLLVEGALDGAELAVLALIKLRLRSARRDEEGAKAAVNGAYAEFADQAIQRLTALGIDYEEPWTDFLARLGRFQRSTIAFEAPQAPAGPVTSVDDGLDPEVFAEAPTVYAPPAGPTPATPEASAPAPEAVPGIDADDHDAAA
jgi:hypothetical protein